jgi:hypothetical protein
VNGRELVILVPGIVDDASKALEITRGDGNLIVDNTSIGSAALVSMRQEPAESDPNLIHC